MIQAATPFDEHEAFDEQDVFVEKENIPELVSIEADNEVRGYAFNGLLLKASNSLSINGKTVATDILMKANCNCAISQSNKSYLAEYNIRTDYMETNQLLFRALGFSEQECKQLTYVKAMDMLPIYFVVTGYDIKGDKCAIARPKATCYLNDGTRISYEEANMIMADWLYDSGYESEHYDSFKEYDDIEKARMEANVSRKAIDYANCSFAEDEWSKLEAACLFDIATTYVSSLVSTSQSIYALLCKKYGTAGIILAKVKMKFGLDDQAETVLCGEIGTPDTALLVSRERYDLNGTLDNIAEDLVMKFYEQMGYTGEPNQEIPELSVEVRDELTDTYMYLAKALCNDGAFELYM